MDDLLTDEDGNQRLPALSSAKDTLFGILASSKPPALDATEKEVSSIGTAGILKSPTLIGIVDTGISRYGCDHVEDGIRICVQ